MTHTPGFDVIENETAIHLISFELSFEGSLKSKDINFNNYWKGLIYCYVIFI